MKKVISLTISAAILTLILVFSFQQSEKADLGIIAADHVALRVVNLEKTKNWYVEKLGFVESIHWKAPAYIDPDLHFVYLKLDGFLLEIAGGGKPIPAPASYEKIGDTFKHQGYMRLCLRVENLDHTISKLEERGVEIFAGPNTNPTLNRRFIHVKDNNGFDVEFVEYLN